MSVKIFVMTHKEFAVPADPLYIPIHVGREGKDDLGYLGDNTGKNISDKNCYYSELTGLYWVANNVSDADYFGLCHYRRFFLDEEGKLLTEKQCEDILSKYDVILAKAVYHPKSYYEVYEEAHNIEDLDVTEEVLGQLYPEMLPVFREIVADKKVYSGNMFIAPKEFFREYAQWLFSIFDLVESKIDVSGYDAYHKRVFGFLSEQLLYVWVKYKGLRIFEAPVGLTQEKAETIELKETLRRKLAEGNLASVQEALSVFRKSMKDRPDLMLPASDISGELADMFRVLYICEQELLSGKGGMLQITKDLQMLVRHYRLLGMIAANIAAEVATADQESYFKDSRVSESLLNLLINQNPNLKMHVQKLASAAGLQPE